MSEKNKRTIGLYFKVSPEEMEIIEKNMELLGTSNKRAYLRKMAVNGYIINLDMESIRELVKLIRIVSNNVNQIARRCNETHNLYEQDVKDLKEGYIKIQRNISELIRKFFKL